ncbi:uncharacterized protein LOC111369109 [Olea europaea var. sylvestris]|uniref:uncharacterized protein LOC111369109 n=1 Tax=Olea europaea var. sylvestris TaxID=158386 RepID=UPI000C1D67FF|nr:uncharacterized protein LOC111369109 [Olea europaea var. sylvestris]
MAFLRTQKPQKLSLYSSCYGFIELSPSLKSNFMNLVSSLVEEDNVKVAQEFGIFHAILNAGGVYGMAVWHNTWLNLPHLKSNTENFSSLVIVYPEGPTLSSAGSKARGGEAAEAILKHCMKWLDEKELTSVLSVAFGSQSSPSEAQTYELAKALEANVNFLWVVRTPSAEGFEERIKNSKRGLLQKKGHPRWVLLRITQRMMILITKLAAE